jgi:hypothetical protein
VDRVRTACPGVSDVLSLVVAPLPGSPTQVTAGVTPLAVTDGTVHAPPETPCVLSPRMALMPAFTAPSAA